MFSFFQFIECVGFNFICLKLVFFILPISSIFMFKSSFFRSSICVYDRWCRTQKELNWHMSIFHSKRVKSCGFDCNICDENNESQDEFMRNIEPVERMNISTSVQIHQSDFLVKCNLFDEKIQTRRCLMLHKKKEHIANVAVCWNFTAGNCELGDDICWFSHSKQSKTELSKCNICGQVLKTLNDLQQHKKREHVLTHHAEMLRKARAGMGPIGAGLDM